MKRFSTYALFLLTIACASLAPAEPSWIAINTSAFGKDTVRASTDAQRSLYSAYYCTTATAAELFDGKSSATAVAKHIAANFDDSATDLDDYATAVTQNFIWDEFGEQYVFKNYLLAGLDSSVDYLAIVLYNNGETSQGVQVLGNEDWTDSSVAFDDAAAGEVSGWVTVAPEPTSGILLLLGLAGLALKRRG